MPRKSTAIRDVAQALEHHADELAVYPDLQTWSEFLRMQGRALNDLAARTANGELPRLPDIEDLAGIWLR